VRTLPVIDTAQRAGLTLDEIKALLSASPGDKSAIDKLREVADRKLPEIVALLERTEIVRSWLESASRCECPSLSECPLFHDPLPDVTPRQRRTTAAPEPPSGGSARVSPAGASCRT
jgi:MerR, DNA binding